MTSVESAEENQIVKLQMGDGDSAISQESNLDIEMTRESGISTQKRSAEDEYGRNERDTGDGILSGGRRREDCDLQWNG